MDWNDDAKAFKVDTWYVVAVAVFAVAKKNIQLISLRRTAATTTTAALNTTMPTKNTYIYFLCPLWQFISSFILAAFWQSLYLPKQMMLGLINKTNGFFSIHMCRKKRVIIMVYESIEHTYWWYIQLSVHFCSSISIAIGEHSSFDRSNINKLLWNFTTITETLAKNSIK